MRKVVVMLLALVGSSIGHRAAAAGLETLLMPGKVSKAHAKFEENCAACHDRADRSHQTRLCLACHKDVAADVASHAGFHGRLPNIATGECKACHGEHLGRDADIVQLSSAAFDHRLTDFALEGQHRGVACDACHVQGKPFRAARSDCGACHSSDDIHRGGLGANCATCHSTQSWTGARFDHDRTRFALHGAHREIACNSCHLAGVYHDLTRTCAGCHAADDAHRGQRGENCASCHTEKSWKSASFDHEKETGFALRGPHETLDCGACHRSPRFDDKPPRTCIGCHKADDAHAGRFGEDCASCHTGEHFKDTPFDHATRGHFALDAHHAALDCHACHTAPVARQKLPTDCASCHRGSDVHGGALAMSCDSCHAGARWNEDIRFDHDLTDFPLLGMHAIVGCGQCHANKAFAGTPTECVACHRSADVHAGALGTRCADCHSPNAWNLWEFDHGRQTRFALTGRHAELACGACHRRPAAELKLPTDCAACHRDRDVHVGQFGTQCQRCHNTQTFKGARIQ